MADVNSEIIEDGIELSVIYRLFLNGHYVFSTERSGPVFESAKASLLQKARE